jgi:hypothetical protein
MTSKVSKATIIYVAASEVRSHFTLFLVAALLCASTRLGIRGDHRKQQKNVDLTIKSNSSVNYVKIINNKYPVITSPIQ